MATPPPLACLCSYRCPTPLNKLKLRFLEICVLYKKEAYGHSIQKVLLSFWKQKPCLFIKRVTYKVMLRHWDVWAWSDAVCCWDSCQIQEHKTIMYFFINFNKTIQKMEIKFCQTKYLKPIFKMRVTCNIIKIRILLKQAIFEWRKNSNVL